MVEYGSCSDGQHPSKTGREEPEASSMRKGLVVFAAVAACAVLALAVSMQDTAWQPSELEQEIGEYGTGLSQKSEQDADAEYDQTFQEDPGHISRAELRFNAALKAAGINRNGERMAPRAHMRAAPQPRVAIGGGSEWTAYPVLSSAPKSKEDVTVNIYGNNRETHSARTYVQAPRRTGMSSAEAQKDLLGYFDGLDNQIHTQERKHAQEVLHRLGGTKLAAKHSRNRQTSILRLLKKAMTTDEFKNDLKKLEQ